MKSMLSRTWQVSVLAGALMAITSAGFAQGRSRDVPPGIAKKNGHCPPGLEKQGRCYGGASGRYDNGRYDDGRYDDGRYDASRRGNDWCWDRDRDSRCDVTSNGRSGIFYDERLGIYRDSRGNIYDRNGRLIGRMIDGGTVYDRDGRVVREDGRVYDRNGRVVRDGTIRSTVGELIQRAQEVAGSRR